jgi:hypothetical protein
MMTENIYSRRVSDGSFAGYDRPSRGQDIRSEDKVDDSIPLCGSEDS